jgi:4-amino-4-deoxy-L-arabinose transferase-like glycosyltransferase
MPDIGLLQSSKPPRKRRPRVVAAAGAVVAAPEVLSMVETGPMAESATTSEFAPVIDAPAQFVPVSVPEADLVLESTPVEAAPPALGSAEPPLAIAASVIEVIPPAPAPAPAPALSASSEPAPPESRPRPQAPPPTPAVPPGASTAPATHTRDLLLLGVAVVAIVGTGLGVRDPWPADEPRFASIARDMVESGEWFFPRVGGDLYQDKPPVFFWLLAACYSLFGSVKASFLIPSFLSAAGVAFLVYDFGRRLVSRVSGIVAALLVVSTLQFVLAMRGAQIDPVLCLLTTLSMYGFLRHLLLGPAWGWYTLAGFAAGLGVITKGVGFLPLLVLLPYVVMRWRGWTGLAPVTNAGVAGWRWWLAPLAFFAGVSLWFVPMLMTVAASGAADLAAYRDEILFKQTVTRYSGSWHHVKSWYYFLVEVIPPLWLPWSLLLFWLVPRWKAAFRERDARMWLPLAWVLLVLLFFSLSPGKRGIYILPALPVLAFASLPIIEGILARAGVRRAGFALAGLFVAAGLAVAVAVTFFASVRDRAAVEHIDNLALVAWSFAALAAVALFVAWRRAPLLAWPAVLAAVAIVFSYLLAPRMNDERSGRAFMADVLRQVRAGEVLGLVGYREQFLLHLDRPVVNFGHRRSFEGSQEFYDAAAWLNAGTGRVLLVPAAAAKECFPSAVEGLSASRTEWYLARQPAAEACAAKGDAGRAIQYKG